MDKHCLEQQQVMIFIKTAPHVEANSISVIAFITFIIWSTVKEGKRHGQGQERSGDSSRQHWQWASHPHQTGETETSCLFCLCVCVFEASALINSEITHLTSIRAKGSPGSSNQIIRRRRGKGFDCHSLRLSFFFFFLLSIFKPPPPPVPLFIHFISHFMDLLPLTKLPSYLSFSLPELFDWSFAQDPLVLEQQWIRRWWGLTTNKSGN